MYDISAVRRNSPKATQDSREKMQSKAVAYHYPLFCPISKQNIVNRVFRI